MVVWYWRAPSSPRICTCSSGGGDGKSRHSFAKPGWFLSSLGSHAYDSTPALNGTTRCSLTSSATQSWMVSNDTSSSHGKISIFQAGTSYFTTPWSSARHQSPVYSQRAVLDAPLQRG